MAREPRHEPEDGDWLIEHDSTRKNGDGCRIVVCPICDHLGCITTWVEIDKNRAIDPLTNTPLYKIYVIMHAHFLHNFDDRRNETCVLPGREMINKLTEGVWSFRLRRPQIPDNIVEQLD